METILYLLILILPLIFKMVGKNLEKSGNVEKAKKFQQLTQEMFPEEDDESIFGQEINFPTPTPAPTPVQPEPVAQMPEATKDEIEWKEALKRQSLRKPVSAKKQMSAVVEEDTPKKKEKIDPKKLVIYSEIMKTKF